MKVYSVRDDEGTSSYFASIKEARKMAEDCATSGEAVTIHAVWINKIDRERVAAMLNGRSWCSEAVRLETWEPRGEPLNPNPPMGEKYRYKVLLRRH